MRAFFEYTVATIIGCIVVIVGIGIYFNAFLTKPDLSDQNVSQLPPSVLGTATETADNSYEFLETNIGDSQNPDFYVLPENQFTSLLLTNTANSDSYILFDNINLSKIEGTAEPKSAIRMEINSKVFSTTSNSDGSFEIQLPTNLVPFAEASIISLDQEKNELNRKDFIFITRKYLNRYYFLHETKDAVFSIDARDYTGLPTNINVISNESCYGEFVSTNQEKVLDENQILLPKTIENLNSNINGFVVFDIINLNEFYNLDYCMNEWEEISTSFKWH